MAAALAVALLAWPASATFHCPAKGGQAWREFRSAHFRIDTDASDADAQYLVRELEHMHALLLKALVGEQIEIPGHVRVLAFADQTDFRELSGRATLAGYYTRGRFGEPTIVLPVRGMRDDPELTAHELAHHLSFYLFPVQPHWFTEGLAEWVQTVAAPPRVVAAAIGSHLARSGAAMAGGSAGLVPGNLISWIGYDARPMPAREVLLWNGAETAASGGRGHLWSWMLYHWLWNQRSKAFADYQKRLGDSGDAAEAWRLAFPEFDPSSDAAMAKLDAELERYRSSGRFAFYKVEAEGDPRFVTAAVSSSDVHLLILGARVSWATADAKQAFRLATLAEAVAEDPASPGALGEQAGFLGKASADALRAAASGRPNDWIGWLLFAQLAREAPAAEREAALRKAVELNPESAAAQNNLAWLLVTSDRAKEALPIVNRALDLAPWDAGVVDTLAEVAMRMGQCKQAVQLERRAVAGEGTDSLRKKLAEFEQRCK